MTGLQWGKHNRPMASSERVLDPIQRVQEVIFGVLMAMTFIGAMNVATAGREEIRTVMKTALGCNLAWGLADAVMYLVAVITERTRDDLRPRLRGRDLKGALGVFLLVALSTFPLVLPFLFIRELAPALLASRLVALCILFLGGWLLASHARGNRWLAGFALALVGAVLLAAIVALGG
jgi:VIT1/CCC1 family predicted Fe2+/Mn2+ transporter